MTEEEAKTKVCCGPPHIGRLEAWNSAHDRISNPIRCIGSACMAWRWAESGFYATTQKGDRPPQVPAHWTWENGSVEAGEPSGWAEPRHGFCGLAGKP